MNGNTSTMEKNKEENEISPYVGELKWSVSDKETGSKKDTKNEQIDNSIAVSANKKSRLTFLLWVVITFVSSFMIGFSLVGSGSIKEIFSIQTWIHLFQYFFK